jgi:hypothetical protein
MTFNDSRRFSTNACCVSSKALERVWSKVEMHDGSGTGTACESPSRDQARSSERLRTRHQKMEVPTKERMRVMTTRRKRWRVRRGSSSRSRRKRSRSWSSLPPTWFAFSMRTRWNAKVDRRTHPGLRPLREELLVCTDPQARLGVQPTVMRSDQGFLPVEGARYKICLEDGKTNALNTSPRWDQRTGRVIPRACCREKNDFSCRYMP